jgi:hypothetical protein
MNPQCSFQPRLRQRDTRARGLTSDHPEGTTQLEPAATRDVSAPRIGLTSGAYNKRLSRHASRRSLVWPTNASPKRPRRTVFLY